MAKAIRSKHAPDSILDEVLMRAEEGSNEELSYAGIKLTSTIQRRRSSIDIPIIPSFLGNSFADMDDLFEGENTNEAEEAHVEVSFGADESKSKDFFETDESESEAAEKVEKKPEIIVINDGTNDGEVSEDCDNEEVFEYLDADDFDEDGSTKKNGRGLPKLFSFNGKRIQKSEKSEENKPGLLSKAKGFLKAEVYPLFMEVDENSMQEENSTPVEGEVVNSEESGHVDSGSFSAKEMLTSAKEQAIVFGKSTWNFVNEKVTRPLMEKLKLDSEEDYLDDDEADASKRSGELRLVKRDDSYDDEFFDDEIIEDKPTLREKLKRIFGLDSDEEDDYFYEEDDPEEMGFFESLAYLLKRDKNEDSDEVFEGEVIDSEPKAKGRFESIIQKAFFISEEESEVAEGTIIVHEDAEESDEDYAIVPDPEIFAEIMKEKQDKIAAVNADSSKTTK